MVHKDLKKNVFIYIYIYIYIHTHTHTHTHKKDDTKNLWERTKMRAMFWSDVLRDRKLIVSTVIMLIIRNSHRGFENTDLCLDVTVW